MLVVLLMPSVHLQRNLPIQAPDKMEKEFVHRRSEFNHDWLKNKYINSLLAFISTLESQNPDSVLVDHFCTSRFFEWERKRQEAKEIIRLAEEQCSPLSLFLRPPLKAVNAQTMTWLPELAHNLWQGRTRLNEAYENADRAFVRNKRLLSSDAKRDVAELRRNLDLFKEFESYCSAFSTSLSKHTRNIGVV